MSGCAIIIPVGPGQIEVERTRDLLQSLQTYEPDLNATIVLIDDPPLGTIRYLKQEVQDLVSPNFELSVLHNPRLGKGIGSTSGLSAGILAALKWIDANIEAEFVLKLDTDALIIGSFYQRLMKQFTSDLSIGMLGLYKQTCNGESRDHLKFAHLSRKLKAPLALWRQPVSPWQRVTVHLFGRFAKIRRYFQQAEEAGYPEGDFILGGAYAVSGTALRAMAQQGYLEDPLLWINTHFSEDAILSMYIWAVRKRLQGFAAPGEVFGVEHIGLPFSPEELIKKDYAIIHSVKDSQQASETEIRKFFAKKRKSFNQSIFAE